MVDRLKLGVRVSASLKKNPLLGSQRAGPHLVGRIGSGVQVSVLPHHPRIVCIACVDCGFRGHIQDSRLSC